MQLNPLQESLLTEIWKHIFQNIFLIMSNTYKRDLNIQKNVVNI